jgi:hypothetical protein
VSVAKSRGIHIILALLVGAFGFHNFYTGYNVRGGIKFGLIALTTFLDSLTGFYAKFSVVLIVIFSICALLEAIFITVDAQGRQMS